MFRIIQKRAWFFGLSLLIVLPGLYGLVRWGLPLGIDFTGGTIIEYERATGVNLDPLRQVFRDEGFSPVIQPTGPGQLTVRLEHLTPLEREQLAKTISDQWPELTETSFQTIGPTIGRELRGRATLATGLVLVAILLYVTWAFRRVSVGPVRSWVYGGATLIALFHDLLVVIGIFAFLGRFAGTVVDSLFVTALLTVLGFSVHDTIVVFDRIRERLLTAGGQSFEETVNQSINQTLARSLNTSLTTLFVLSALALFGGESIRGFTLALIIGITAGTYSSIFVASALVVVWQRLRVRE